MGLEDFLVHEIGTRVVVSTTGGSIAISKADDTLLTRFAVVGANGARAALTLSASEVLGLIEALAATARRDTVIDAAVDVQPQLGSGKAP